MRRRSPDAAATPAPDAKSRAARRITEEQVLQRLREICAALPGSEEVVTYGHPGWKVKGHLYAVLEEYKKELSICVKVGASVMDLFLRDPRYYQTPYIGHHGWISLKVYAAPLKWEEIRELVAGSHQLVADTRPRRRTADRR